MLHRYRLGILFAGKAVGAGSVYVMDDVVATFRFLLLWVLPFAYIIDVTLHDMSARLAVRNEALV